MGQGCGGEPRLCRLPRCRVQGRFAGALVWVGQGREAGVAGKKDTSPPLPSASLGPRKSGRGTGFPPTAVHGHLSSKQPLKQGVYLVLF